VHEGQPAFCDCLALVSQNPCCRARIDVLVMPEKKKKKKKKKTKKKKTKKQKKNKFVFFFNKK
jgi:hypothetical protein